MTLTEVIKAAAERMKHVMVSIHSGMGTVRISAEGEEDIFLQGHEGDDFIEAVNELYTKAGDVTYYDASLAHAETFTECLWS